MRPARCGACALAGARAGRDRRRDRRISRVRRTTMFLLTGKVGGAAARHPWRTVAAWLILIVALFGLKTAFGGQYQDNYALPGAPSQAGADFLRASFPLMSGTDARVVIHAAAGRRVDPAVLTE